MSLTDFINCMNEWGQRKIPFLFLVDFELKKPLIWRLNEVDPAKIKFNFNGITNDASAKSQSLRCELSPAPISLGEYSTKFDRVMRHLEYGDTFLANLTIRSRIFPSLTLPQLYGQSKAKYKLMLADTFLCFSPETFIQIRGREIFSYPMKGTMDARLPQARQKLMNDTKEVAEHVTIVDLIRNDLSMVAKEVKVTRFRYIEEILTNGTPLLQVSSEIVGTLQDSEDLKIGNIIVALLPAGSVSGAPKKKTVEVLQAAEGTPRGYYTGVAGIFNGHDLDSGVMIRFIEQDEDSFYYRSGGGLTTQSRVESEYQEAIDKIYVPVY